MKSNAPNERSHFVSFSLKKKKSAKKRDFLILVSYAIGAMSGQPETIP